MDAQFAAFCLLALGLTIMPGADMALVAKNAVAQGRRASLYTTLGICGGCTVHAVASALGLSVVLARSALAFEIVKLIGALYLIWLGWTTLRRAAACVSAGVEADGERAPAGRRPAKAQRSFVEGLLTNLLNPKVALFYLMVLPQFIAPDQDVLLRSLLLAGIHIGFGLIWLTAYASLLHRLDGLLRRPRVRAWFEGVIGTVLILLGGRLAIQRR